MMSHYNTRKKIDILLKLIAGGTAISSSLLAPKAVELFMKTAEKYIDKDFDRKELEKLLQYMEKTKLIELKVTPIGSISANLNQKAIKRLNQYEMDDITIDEPDAWDKKWRILLYDIPAKEKSARYYLLEQLHRLGFYMVQKSIWVYPYTCTDELTEILHRLELEQYATFIVGDIQSTIDPKLIKHFQLHHK